MQVTLIFGLLPSSVTCTGRRGRRQVLRRYTSGPSQDSGDRPGWEAFRRILRRCRGPRPGNHRWPPRPLASPSPGRRATATWRASGSANRILRLLGPSGPPTATYPTGFMIADAVRYMSVHSWKQPDSHGHSGTSPGQKEQPARPGNPSSRAIFAGGGRCWVRTNVG